MNGILSLTFNIHSRDGLILLFNKVGHSIIEAKRAEQFVMTIGGLYNGGKSLIALGIDSAFRPDQYRNGIGENIKAEEVLPNGRESVNPVALTFMGRVVYPFDHMFDRVLRELAQASPNAHVVIATNLERTFTGSFDYAAKGLSSERLDMHVEVERIAGDFGRKIEITMRDQAIFDKMKAWKYAGCPALVAA